MSAKRNIAIVGGGWAGLSAAVELCRQGHKVSVFESAPQLGGRARSIEWNGMTLDNGQHLMLGAYQQMLQCLNSIQADTSQLFKQLPHRMLMLDTQTGKTTFDLNLPTYPAPLHLLFGVLGIKGLSAIEKVQLLLRFNRLLNTQIKIDLPVREWLTQAKLPVKYITHLLEPVCLAALTTHPQLASAKAFQSVLQQTFNAPASFTDLLIPTTDLSQIFPVLAEQFILQHGGEVRTRCKVKQLNIENSQVKSLQLDNEVLEFEQVILATPARVTAKLLEPDDSCANIVKQIKQLKYEPVSTLYLQFSQPVSLPYPMLGLLNGQAEWVFELSVSAHSHILAVVISAQGNATELSADELLKAVHKELTVCIANLPELLDSKLIIDKYASFQCHTNVDKNRPTIDTDLRNLKLCGDYVYIEENNRPGLPSTLEGAMRSGVKCAQLIL